jgi:hypothetical protein
LPQAKAGWTPVSFAQDIIGLGPGVACFVALQQALAPNKVRAGETAAEHLVFMNQVSRFHHTDRLRS